MTRFFLYIRSSLTCANPRAVIPNMLLACIFNISCSKGTEPQADGSLTAKAGLDQFVADVDIDGFGTVTLDGSASQGTIVSYDWSEGGSVIATSVNPTVELAIGIHSITLTVADNGGEEASDEVTVTVNSTSGHGRLLQHLTSIDSKTIFELYLTLVIAPNSVREVRVSRTRKPGSCNS